MTAFQVSHPVQWTDATHGGSLPSVLSWTSKDALAVTVIFGTAVIPADPGDERFTTWVFSREMLADVVSGRCKGTGSTGNDVYMARLKNAGLSGDQFVLRLEVSFTVMLYASFSEISFFLDSTFAFVPHGEEVIDIDKERAGLPDEWWKIDA